MQSINNKKYQNSGNAEVLSQLCYPGKILDVGCGSGDNARILNERGFTVDGITISVNELDQALPFLRKAYLSDLEKGLPEEVRKEKYDYIICSHVLEHICYPGTLLNQVRECLKEGGKLVVALPNLMHYSSRWKLMKGNFDYQEMGIWDNTHFRWYTYESGKRLLEEHGYKLVHQKVSGHIPGFSFFSRFLPVLSEKKIFSFLVRVSPGLFGYQLIYVATK